MRLTAEDRASAWKAWMISASVRETGDLYEAVVDVEGLNGKSRSVMTVWLVGQSTIRRAS